MRKEVKQLVIEKKLDMWNNIVEKANQDFEGNKSSVSSTKGKLQILQQHYQLLGTSVVDSAFHDEWKLEVEEKVLECSKQN